jgi:PKD repeat protein
LFDPILSGIGNFPIDYVYKDANGCTIEKSINVIVEALPTITASDTIIVCVGSGMVSLEEILNISANPVGGAFSFLLGNIAVTDMIDLANYNVSVLPVTIIYNRNLCEVKDSAFIQFIEKPILSISADTTLCIFDSLFMLSANFTGGSWSGPGVDVSTGIINLNIAGEVNKMYTYTFQPNTSCAQTQTVNIEIKNPGINLNAGLNQEACEGLASFTLSGNSPTNGLWSGVGIDPITGNIDVTQLTLDSLYSYTYCITDLNIQGCQACKSKTFIVHSLPIPLFGIDGLTCINEDITIIDQTLGNNTIIFDLGDGTVSSADSIIHQYTDKGTYTISLQVTNEFICSASISEQINVTVKPISAFTIIDNEGCAPFLLTILNQSSGDSISYKWNFNDTTYTDATPPSVILDGITKDSIFIVSLAVTNQCGEVTYEDSVLVHPYPIVDFGVSEQNGCSPLTVDFANTSLGNPTTYFWDMGNGNIYLDSIPPSQIYTTLPDQVTTYNILYIGTNSCGTDSIIKEVTIYPPDVSAFIEAPGLSLCQYDTLVLTAFSTPGAINTWKLIAPDGTLSGASGDIAFFDMSQAGIYTAILYASRCGSDTDTVLITVFPAPFIDFDLPSFACEGSPVSFTNLGLGIGGVIWDYGDGNIDPSGIHVYDSVGVFTVTLTAFSLVNNCPYTVSKTIRIIGLPTASFVPSLFSGCEPLQISFSNNSTPGSNYDWDFGDNTSNSNDQNPTHTFEQDGTFKVKLTVYDGFGCFSDTSVLNIIVHPKPESRIGFPMKKYCHRYDSIPFTNLSIGSVGQEWILGDNNFDTQNITWLPSDSGALNITLVAISNFGCLDSSNIILDILPSPISNFMVDKVSGCKDLSVSFSNLSTSSTQYIWDLKNGTKSVEKNLDYTFTNPGTYEVSLVSLTDNGCPFDTISKTITVHPKPKADFDIEKDSVCGVPMFVNFINNSTGNLDNVWSINGMSTSQDPSFGKVFTTPSNNDISLIVQNEFLCADTIYKTVDIYLQPIADFDVKGQACEGESITIENNSINAISYIWDIQNQGTTTIVEPELIFEKSGTYFIKLIAVYNEFCQDTFSLAVPIRIFDSPSADFEYQGGYDEKYIRRSKI